MKRKTIFGLLAVMVVGLLVTGMVAAFGGFNQENREAIKQAIGNKDYEAWKNAMTAGITEERFNQMVERHQNMAQHREAIDAAFESGDYEAWKAAVADSPRGNRMSELITEDNFEQFAQMHKARQDGDLETAKQIAEELGLPMKGSCSGKFGFRGRMH